jgi:hypothetical protein
MIAVAGTSPAMTTLWDQTGSNRQRSPFSQRRRAFGVILARQPGRGIVMLIVLINIAIVIVVGAILFYVIDKYVRDKRLAGLLKILVALICIVEILRRLLPAFGVGLF